MGTETFGHQGVPAHIVALLRDSKIPEGLHELRSHGFTLLQSVLAVHQISGMSLADSKRTVHSSDAWRDSFDDRSTFYAEVEAAMQEIVDDLEAGNEPQG